MDKGVVSRVEQRGFGPGEWLTSAAVAAKYGISAQTVRQAGRRGTLRGVCSDEGWKFRLDDVERWRAGVATATSVRRQQLEQLKAELAELETRIDERLDAYNTAETVRDEMAVRLAKLDNGTVGTRNMNRQINDAELRIREAAAELQELREERGAVIAELGDVDARQRELDRHRASLPVFQELAKARDAIDLAVAHIEKAQQLSNQGNLSGLIGYGFRDLARRLGPAAGTGLRMNMDAQVNSALAEIPIQIRQLEAEV